MGSVGISPPKRLFLYARVFRDDSHVGNMMHWQETSCACILIRFYFSLLRNLGAILDYVLPVLWNNKCEYDPRVRGLQVQQFRVKSSLQSLWASDVMDVREEWNSNFAKFRKSQRYGASAFIPSNRLIKGIVCIVFPQRALRFRYRYRAWPGIFTILSFGPPRDQPL